MRGKHIVTWLVTGGAGYIGAHVVRALRADGARVVVVDDLSSGDPSNVPPDVPLIEASVLARSTLEAVMRQHEVGGVIHLAAKKAVAESVADPLRYYRENVGGFEAVLSAMVATGVRRVVLSSSAAVYGVPSCELVSESVDARPVNPYGRTKLICETLLSDLAAAVDLDWVALRYFNVAGAAEPALSDASVENLVPMAFDALTRGRRPLLFGADYPTPDGSCVRDFIHVVDVALAHLAAVRRLDAGSAGLVYNVGRGEGFSVREVFRIVAEVTGRLVDPQIAQRRAGDPARVVADARAIETDLGWRAQLDLRDMIETAWAGWRSRVHA